MRLSVWRAVGVPRCFQDPLPTWNVREVQVDGDPGAGRARPRVR
jgi:hypothetical protein